MTEISDDDFEDIGGALEKKIKGVLDNLNFNREAANLIERSSGYWRFELPEMPEEIITLRGERHKLILVSGIETTEDEEFVSFVAVAQPFMGWEIFKFCGEDLPDKKRPVWTKNFGEHVRGKFSRYDEYNDYEFSMRNYKPAYAVDIHGNIDDDNEFKRRKDVFLKVLNELCHELGFQIFSSESGDIPKEIEDKYIHPKLVKVYNKSMNDLDKKLVENPDDVDLLFKKAGLLVSRDRNDEAVPLVKKCIKLQPRSYQSWYLLSDIYMKLGNNEKSRRMEAKARKIQKYHGGALHSAGDITEISSIYSSFYDQMSSPNNEDDEEDDEDETVCMMCKNDFLYFTNYGLLYICNACGHVGEVEGAALKVELGIDKSEYLVSESDRIEFMIKLENISKYDLEYTTEHEGMEFIVFINYPANKKGRRGNEDVEYEGGRLIVPKITKKLKPGQKDELKIKLHDIEILDDRKNHFLKPANVNIGLWMKARILASDDEFDSITDSDDDIHFSLI